MNEGNGMTLIESIYAEPGAWTPGEYWFTHKSGAKLWIANGPKYCSPPGDAFGMFTRKKAWRAYRWWSENAPVESFGGRQS